jgi:hypothetical protein
VGIQTQAPTFRGWVKDARYQGFVTLEYEEPEDAWIAVPRELEKLRKACQG